MFRRLLIVLALASLMAPLAASAGDEIEIVVPPDMTVEADGPAGSRVTFTAHAYYEGREIPVVCTPASGSTFGIRQTTVRCEAEADDEEASRSFRITVQDTTGPVVTVPADMRVETTDPSGAIATFTASASDRVNGNRPVSCTPASGTRFPWGTTQVRCSSTDTRGNTGSATFNVLVAAPRPIITVPPDLRVEGDAFSGGTVTYTASARTYNGIAIPVTCSPASGTVFGFGQTTVTCRATDPYNGETATRTFRVTVVDTTPPRIRVPAAKSVRPTGRKTVVRYSVHAVDVVDGFVAFSCLPPSGARFALGVTQVTCSATDRAGNVGSGAFSVSVVRARSALRPALYQPQAGARLTAPPRLAWRAVKKARFYNVQVYRRGQKVLSAWPSRPRLRLHKRWRFNGRAFTLKPGRYVWYVWPGFGPNRYGRAIGSSTFTFAPSRSTAR